jgi:pyruvate, water dikinase
MNIVPLAEAHDERRYGGKAVQLGSALKAGLPVPDGLALSHEFVEQVASGDATSRATLETSCALLNGRLAVRSSAIGEDSATASFAGQHATFLNASVIPDAIEAIWRSGRTDSALDYRRRLGVDGPVLMGVIVQKLVAAEVAGVLFTRHPVTGADELLAEASWGLGESVVQGLVVPDQFRISKSGEILSRRPGSKRTAIRPLSDGSTSSQPVDPRLVGELCLTEDQLGQLYNLACNCDRVFGPGPHDIEWAFEAGALYLLQRRPVTGSTG